MKSVPTGRITERLSDLAHRLEGVPVDYDPLMDLVGDARVVLLGEASHGTLPRLPWTSPPIRNLFG